MEDSEDGGSGILEESPSMRCSFRDQPGSEEPEMGHLKYGPFTLLSASYPPLLLMDRLKNGQGLW